LTKATIPTGGATSIVDLYSFAAGLDIRITADFWIGALFSIADPQQVFPLPRITVEAARVSVSFLIADRTAICRQKLQKKGIGVVPTQARATAFQLRWDERLLMNVTSERIRNIIPAAIARLAIHVQTSSASFSTSSRSSGVMSTGLMFFSTSFGLTFFLPLGLLPVLSQNTPIQLSISNTRFRKR
jgi:hypothetical protein